MATKGNPKGISDLKAITKADFARPSMFRVHLSRDGVGETKQDFFIQNVLIQSFGKIKLTKNGF